MSSRASVEENDDDDDACRFQNCSSSFNIWWTPGRKRT